MAPGDVFLIDIQRWSYDPIELDDPNFDAIRLAVASGIIVLEGAGNGGLNLDLEDQLNRESIHFLDSGAIMVGATYPETYVDGFHERWLSSNYGSRIDCYAWGEGVVSSGECDPAWVEYCVERHGCLDPGVDENTSYTHDFRGTSSASAIISGAAILIQDACNKQTGTKLSPRRQMAESPI